MDEHEFQSELKNYKVIRRADYHKVYTSKKYQQQQQQIQKPSKPKKNSAANEKSGKPVSTDGKGFWELLESTLKGTLTPVEINRFLAALRQEHSHIHEKVTLHDLENIASSLSPS